MTHVEINFNITITRFFILLNAMNYGVIRRIFCRFNQRPIIYDDKSYSY